MAPECGELLQSIPESERQGFVFNPILPVKGTRSKAVTVIKRISRTGELSGIKVSEKRGVVKFASAHDLRRAYGFRWSQRVMPNVLQQMMRHSNIETTMQFFVGRNAETAAEALWQAMANTSANTPVFATEFSTKRERVETSQLITR